MKSITGLHHARCSALRVAISHTGSSCLQWQMKISITEPGIVLTKGKPVRTFLFVEYRLKPPFC
jgi:hypothetical protein